jgi:upstream activation factor subunit UAF30
MPKKTSVKNVETDLTATAVVPPVVVEKKTKSKSKSTDSVVPVVDSVSKETVVVVESVSKESVLPVSKEVVDSVSKESVALVLDSDNEVPLSDLSVEFLSKLHQLGNTISSLKTEYRTLEKKWLREIKISQKQNNRKKRNGKNRAPSGFVKPTKISDELASFLGKEVGTEMARTEVTRDINAYIRTNKLQDKDNGRKILPDTKLATLLKLSSADELTYFNLQKYMSPHFAKAVKVVSAEVAV